MVFFSDQVFFSQVSKKFVVGASLFFLVFVVLALSGTVKRNIHYHPLLVTQIDSLIGGRVTPI